MFNMYFLIGFMVGALSIPVLLKMAEVFGLYTCVPECQSQVYTLFGKVIGTIFIHEDGTGQVAPHQKKD